VLAPTAVFAVALHDGDAQIVVSSQLWHAPLPSQVPSLAQLAFVSGPHVGCPVSGDCPPGRGEHVPALPGTLHALHALAHAVMQQTPSTQRPELHALAPLQGAPFAWAVACPSPPARPPSSAASDSGAPDSPASAPGAASDSMPPPSRP